MKLRILSDLHIEFNDFSIPALDTDNETVLVLAGDIGVIKKRAGLEGFLRKCAQQFKYVIYVLGNHEYYASVFPNALNEQLREWNLPDNLHILECDILEIDGYYFVGATLWSDFDSNCINSMRDAGKMLNDYRYIMTDPELLGDNRYILPEDQLNCFEQTIVYLNKKLEQLSQNNNTDKSYINTNKPFILVTHHGISRQSIHNDYKDSKINGAFVSDCEWLIKKHKPVLAIHGHVHNSFDYLIRHDVGATRVVVNPRGYTYPSGAVENPSFNPYLLIEV